MTEPLVEEIKLGTESKAFADFHPMEAWKEEKQKTLVDLPISRNQEINITYRYPANQVIVTGSFDNWSMSNHCEKVYSTHLIIFRLRMAILSYVFRWQNRKKFSLNLLSMECGKYQKNI